MKAKHLLLGALSLLLIAALIVLVTVAPWKSDDESDAQTFALDRDVTASVTVPDGWKAATSKGSDTGLTLVIVPQSETRTSYDDLNAAVKKSGRDGAVAPVHAVFATAGDCGALNLPAGKPADGQWKYDKPTSTTANGISSAAYRAVQRVDQNACLIVVGLDSQHGKTLDSRQAVDLAQQLATDGQISGSITR